MKKILIAIAALLVAAPVLFAVPADPKPFKYTQPDGSIIILQNHGDEYYNWRTDERGRIVEKGADGFYRPITISPQAHRARYARQRPKYSMWSSYENHPSTNLGEVKILCLIANFSDSTFVIDNPRQHFDDMLNQEGYSVNGAIGSVRDYYIDNSLGQYRPHFDVYGPVDLSQSSAYYSNYNKSPMRVKEAILEAVELLGDQITLADYDNDHDGNVDMILFYYPGHNPAEGADAAGIWPHQSSTVIGTAQGLGMNRYFCTSELRGVSGTVPAPIGTTCHEFAHSLGVPDFYDTDYEVNGQARTSSFLDLMDAGSYNDNGRRPPYLSAVERNMLGWSPDPEKIEASQDYVLEPVLYADAQANRAYRIDSRVENEYFILEARDKNTKWDSGLGVSGLVVYHVDKSSLIVADGMTAAYLWENTNMINVYGSHPCYTSLYQGERKYRSDYVFPGSNSITSLDLYDWDGNTAAAGLTDLTVLSEGVSFHATLSHKAVDGYVADRNGHPIEGARVVLSPSAYVFAAVPAVRPNDKSCLTDENGYYCFEMDDNDSDCQVITVRKEGFVSTSLNVLADKQFSRVYFKLFAPGDGGPATLRKYDDSSWFIMKFGSEAEDQAIGIRYTAEELSAMKAAGAALESVTFFGYATVGTDCEAVYLLVDIDGERMLQEDITDIYTPYNYNGFNVSSAGIVIPEGKDLFIGYGLKGVDTSKMPYLVTKPDEPASGACMCCEDFLNSSVWVEHPKYEVILSAVLGLKVPVDFSTHGVSFISLSDGVPTVNVAAGKTIKDSAWYLDGEAVEAPVSIGDLPAGPHTYMVRLRFYDGTSERIYYDVN